MSSEPCGVCGNTDVNLIDGYYYCVECGTQDTNVRDTRVVHKMLADQTFGIAHVKKVKIVKDGPKMSSEWYKWHAYNFILFNLVEELIELGAQPSLRMKVLWVWVRYIKKFQIKEEISETKLDLSSLQGNEETKQQHEDINSENSDQDIDQDTDQEILNDSIKKRRINTFDKRINFKLVTRSLLLSIILIGLNLDNSEILITDVIRFIKEKRLSYLDCRKFIPKDISMKSIPDSHLFTINIIDLSELFFRRVIMILIKTLDLGTIIMPNMKNIIERYVMELSLPKDFEDLVLALTYNSPCDFLEQKTNSNCVPDYAGVAMAYIVVALKMVFGLDDQYDIQISEAVESINKEKQYPKTYRLGSYCEPTERLFSFQEWCNYLQFRKNILCKYYLPMASQYDLEVDDYAFMDQLDEQKKREILLSDEITMNILDQIPVDEASLISKSDFLPTLTPITTNKEVILQHIQDPDLRLLLSEDFSQYSLKYAIKDMYLKLFGTNENRITGITEENKIITANVDFVTKVVSKSDRSLVFVRNCANKNWLKTKPPTIKHVTTNDENNVDDKSSANEYDSDEENTPLILIKKQNNAENTDIQDDVEEEKDLETIDEEDSNINIFDDDFENMNDDDIKIKNDSEDDNVPLDLDNSNLFESNPNNDVRNETKKEETLDNGDASEINQPIFDPNKFNRDDIIKELILAACREHKIPVPNEYKPQREIRKRKSDLIRDEAGVSEPKTKRVKAESGSVKAEVEKLIEEYYKSMEYNVMQEVAKTVNSFYNTVNDQNDISEITFGEPLETDKVEGSQENECHITNDETEVQSNSIIEVNSVADSSVINNSDEEEQIRDISQSDPKFDEKEYDIKQLYLKLKANQETDDINLETDSVLNEIVTKKIKDDMKDSSKEIIEDSKSDSDVEAMLTSKESTSDNEAEFHEKLKQKQQMKVTPLTIMTKENNECNFKYWFRHYLNHTTKVPRMRLPFDKELNKSFPKSFSFVLRECAAISGHSPFDIYKHVQTLEKNLLAINMPHRKARRKVTSKKPVKVSLRKTSKKV